MFRYKNNEILHSADSISTFVAIIYFIFC